MAGQATSAERRGQPSHRDDLRSVLLAAASDLVAREGHEDLSIRKLAKYVGVTSGAPYHHFADRRALLTGVALEGYAALYTLFVYPSAGEGDTALGQTLLNFIRFAAENPRMFTLMYESELVRPTLSAELASAQDRGFRFLRDEVSRLCPALSERERSVRGAAIWSAVFGFAIQSNRAMLRAHQHEPAPKELAQEIVRQMLRLLL